MSRAPSPPAPSARWCLAAPGRPAPGSTPSGRGTPQRRPRRPREARATSAVHSHHDPAGGVARSPGPPRPPSPAPIQDGGQSAVYGRQARSLRACVSPEPNHLERQYGPREALQLEFPQRLGLDEFLDIGQNSGRDENLPGQSFGAEPCGEVGDRADRPVIPPPLEADRPDGRVPLGDAHAEIELEGTLPPPHA